MTSIFKMLVGPYANKRSEIDNESGKLPKRFYFFLCMGSPAAANVSSLKLDNL